MGAGLHGLNGTGPEVANIQYETYITPTLLYGLEVLVLSKPELATLEAYHRKNIRYIQHLPQSTATPAIYLLLGSLPIEAQLHIKTLSLFRTIVAAESNIPPAIYIQNLIIRQLATKQPESSSWINLIKTVLRKYSLPTPYQIIQTPPKKQAWKRTVKKAVINYHTVALQKDAAGKTSLQYLNITACSLETVHLTWKNLSSPLDIQKATVKAQLLVKRYPLATSPTAGAR